jgi:hypothetical protein
MLNQHLKSLLHKPVTRKEFLRIGALGVISIFGIGGVVTELLSHAQTPYTDGQAETGTLAGTTATIADSSASGGSAVQFGTAPGGGGGTTPPNPTDISIVFPADAGHIDVTLHGADNTGLKDCTSIVNGLISANTGKPNNQPVVIYFPAGIYLISSSIVASDPNLTFRGENVNKTTIKMRDGVWTTATTNGPLGFPTNPGFSNGSQPVADGENSMLVTGGSPENNAFNNYVFDLTFDLGNNPGGGCIGFWVNNNGGIRRCNFTCTAGYIGIDFGRELTGPGIITDCNFSGPFAMPWITYGQYYNYIMERCNVTTASPFGYSGYQGSVMGIKDCSFVQPLWEVSGASDTTYWNSPAIQDKNVYGARVQYLAPGTKGFVIPDVDTPLVPYDPISDWINAATYPGGVQAALNSGKSTIYFPANVSPGLPSGLTIPDSVNRIIAMGYGPTPSSWSQSTPFFETTGSSATPLTFEWGNLQASQGGDSPTVSNDQNTYTYVKHSSTRELVFLDWSGFGIIQGTPGCGTIYLDDVFMRVNLVAGNKLYARQWNWEDPFVTALTNTGGQAWIFGLKTEFPCQAPPNGHQPYNWTSYPCGNFKPTILATAGGRTDMCVGFAYPSAGIPTTFTEYNFVDASYALSWENYMNGGVQITWDTNNGLSSSPAVTAASTATPQTNGTWNTASLSYNGG